MVDASVGGKVGVDFELVKNAVGVFRQPTAVIIDEAFLETLPRRELLSGFAEVIKHALIANTSLWNQITSYRHIDDIPWKLLLRPSIEIKKRIVEQDPYEGGMRKLLNFGHTVGHALESFSIAKGEALKHGEAVAMGMVCEVILSEKVLGFPKNERDRIVELILRHFSPFYVEERDFSELLNWMRKDKKNRQKKIGFTLLKKPGEAEFNIFLDEAEILHALKSYRDIVNSRMA
jgi:3-dehydroquinate synthase